MYKLKNDMNMASNMLIWSINVYQMIEIRLMCGGTKLLIVI